MFSDVRVLIGAGPLVAVAAVTSACAGDGAVSVDSSEVDASKPADRMADFWQWNGSSWQKSGDGRCGGWASSGGGPAGPTVDFISVCRR